VNGPHVHPKHAAQAIDAASGGPIAEGSVGGGTGMTCYAFKGGSGTASRRVDYGSDEHTVAVFVQANFGSRAELTISGVPVGRYLTDDNPQERPEAAVPGAGSVITVVATDAPLLPGQCKALARRVPMGLARTGTSGSHFSGDLFLAFSTANPGALTSGFPKGQPTYETLRFIPWSRIDAFYAAVVQAVEEAVINALVASETMIGRDGHRSPGLPHARVRELLTGRAGSST
ncbi:MAG: P1 family peptidase, partial [Pseudonocardia sp.]|nr:P1 family peptidase [Pseudonocardia sp.]